jgi:hypothetical protein
MSHTARAAPLGIQVTTYAELEKIVHAFAAGHFQLLILLGSHGLGKSRMVRQRRTRQLDLVHTGQPFLPLSSQSPGYGFTQSRSGQARCSGREGSPNKTVHTDHRGRKSRMAAAISAAYVSSAKCPVPKRRTTASGKSCLKASGPLRQEEGVVLAPHRQQGRDDGN